MGLGGLDVDPQEALKSEMLRSPIEYGARRASKKTLYWDSSILMMHYW